MVREMTETYKKYTIQRIINPGVYWMSRNHVGFKRERQQFDYLLRKNVEKIINTKGISVGEIIAVKDQAGFHRGLVTDIFNRNSRTTYLILLIDYGNMIESNEENIYWIKSKEMIERKASAIKVSIKGIQPVALDLKYDKHFSNSIFQKRVQENWSACAYKYVQKLFEKNPHVFVKSLHTCNSNIFGEVFFMQDSENAPVSLGKKLCDNGFAIFSEMNSKVSDEANLEGDQDLSIVEKIPEGALSPEPQQEEMFKSSGQVNKNINKDIDGMRITTSALLDNINSDLHPQQKKLRHFREQNIPSFKSIIESNITASLVPGSNTHGPSLIAEICNFSSSSHLHCDAFKRHDCPDSRKTSPTLILEKSKESMFRVVQRSLELYEKQKKDLRGHCHN